MKQNSESFILQILMGYNQTFEIIIKDIQDIEKLVGNFKNYSRVPKIELDLTLSKLRNVYDLILMFGEAEESSPDEGNSFEFVGKEGNPPKPQPEIKEEPLSGEPEKPEEKKEEKKEISPKPSAENTQQEVSRQLPPLQNEDIRLDKKEEDMIRHHQEEERKKQSLLSGQYEKRKEFINEKLGEKTNKNDISSRLQSSPIKTISGSMGINDKFYFIRELFKGDAEKFRSTLDVLDHTNSFEGAVKYLKDNFSWDMDSPTVQQFLNLVRRKFITGK